MNDEARMTNDEAERRTPSGVSQRVRGMVKSWNKHLSSGYVAAHLRHDAEYYTPEHSITPRHGRRILVVGEEVEFEIKLIGRTPCAVNVTFPPLEPRQIHHD